MNSCFTCLRLTLRSVSFRFSTSSTISHQASQKWLHNIAEKIVSDVLMPSSSTDPVYDFHRSFLHHIVRHWKWSLPRFLATGCRNYAAESVNLTANLKADFPKHISYIATHNRTVNTSGVAGRGKAIDQFIEHYNL